MKSASKVWSNCHLQQPKGQDIVDRMNPSQMLGMPTSLLFLGIHDIMYQASKQLIDIVKPMVQNKIQQAQDFKVV